MTVNKLCDFRIFMWIFSFAESIVYEPVGGGVPETDSCLDNGARCGFGSGGLGLLPNVVSAVEPTAKNVVSTTKSIVKLLQCAECLNDFIFVLFLILSNNLYSISKIRTQIKI